MRQRRVESVEPVTSEVDDRDSQRILDLIEQLDLDLIETEKNASRCATDRYWETYT